MPKNKLDDKIDKRMVLLRIEEGFTYNEISRDMNIHISTVTSHIKKFLSEMYRVFINEKRNISKISIRYQIDYDTTVKCLKEAEKMLHIGICFSLINK